MACILIPLQLKMEETTLMDDYSDQILLRRCTVSGILGYYWKIEIWFFSKILIHQFIQLCPRNYFTIQAATKHDSRISHVIVLIYTQSIIADHAYTQGRHWDIHALCLKLLDLQKNRQIFELTVFYFPGTKLVA